MVVSRREQKLRTVAPRGAHVAVFLRLAEVARSLAATDRHDHFDRSIERGIPDRAHPLQHGLVQAHIEVAVVVGVRLHVVGAAHQQRRVRRRAGQPLFPEVVGKRHGGQLRAGRMPGQHDAPAAARRKRLAYPRDRFAGFAHDVRQGDLRNQVVAHNHRGDALGQQRLGDESECLLGLVAPGAPVKEQHDRPFGRTRVDVDQLPRPGAVAHITVTGKTGTQWRALRGPAFSEGFAVGHRDAHVELAADLGPAHPAPDRRVVVRRRLGRHRSRGRAARARAVVDEAVRAGLGAIDEVDDPLGGGVDSQDSQGLRAGIAEHVRDVRRQRHDVAGDQLFRGVLPAFEVHRGLALDHEEQLDVRVPVHARHVAGFARLDAREHRHLAAADQPPVGRQRPEVHVGLFGEAGDPRLGQYVHAILRCVIGVHFESASIAKISRYTRRVRLTNFALMRRVDSEASRHALYCGVSKTFASSSS